MEKPTPEDRILSHTPQQARKQVLTLLAVLLAIPLVCIVYQAARPRAAQRTSPLLAFWGDPNADLPELRTLDIGAIGSVKSRGRGPFFGATARDEQEWAVAMMTGQRAVIARKLAAGSGYLVAPGTQAQMLNYGDNADGFPLCYVQLLNGPYAGRKGWLPVTMVVK